MNKKRNKNAFTIAELVFAMMLISCIAMILMPSLVKNNEDNILWTALNKMNTDLNQTYNAIYVLETRGKLGIDYNDMAGTMMEAIRLSQKVIEQGTKFDQYIYNNSPTFSGHPAYTDYINDNGNTIILKNTMFVTKINNSIIAIDINGRKKPNQTGRDIFFYHFTTLGNCGEGLSGEINFGGFCKPPTGGAPQCCTDIDDTCAINGEWAHSRGCATKYLQAGRFVNVP